MNKPQAEGNTQYRGRNLLLSWILKEANSTQMCRLSKVIFTYSKVSSKYTG